MFWSLLAGLLAVLALVAGKVGAYQKETSELPVYLTGAERMAAGVEIYRPDDAKPFTYPPFFALPFVPLTWLPEDLQRGAFYLVNVTCLLLLLWIVHRMTRGPRLGCSTKRMVLFWGLTLALAGRHLTSPFENQSHDLQVAVLVGFSIWAFAAGREGISGLAAGIGAACKATPLLYGLLYAANLRLVAGLTLLVSVAGATLLPDLLCPRDDQQLWVQAWYSTFLGGLEAGGTASAAGAWSASSFLNQSLSGTVYRLLTPIESPGPFSLDVYLFDPGTAGRRAIILTAQMLVVIVLVVAARSGRGRNMNEVDARFHRFGQAAAFACGMVLLSPMSSKSHFCVLLFAIAFCVADFVLRRRDLVVGLLLLVILVSGTLTTKGLVGRESGNVLLAHGTVTWATLATLACTVHVLFWGPRRLPMQDPSR